MAITADVIIVVSGGVVQAVYAPGGTKIQLIDFDNLRAGDAFDPQAFSQPDGPPNGPGALSVVAQALELTTRKPCTCCPSAL
jgi:hypothetical protein